MKTYIILPILAAGLQLAQAASVIPLTATSNTNALSGSLGATLNDGGAYDPETGAASFNLVYSTSTGFHGNVTSGQHRLVYTLQSPHTTGNAGPTIALDAFGRSDSSLQRDNNYTVTLYNALGQVAQQTGQAIPDTGGTFHNRTTFSLPASTQITRVEITSPGGPGNPNQWFTLQEVRLASLDVAAVPEPSSTALLGLGGLALILRRRK